MGKIKLPRADVPKKMLHETPEMYELRMQSKVDKKFYEAKKAFKREPYYKQFLKSSQQDIGENEYQE